MNTCDRSKRFSKKTHKYRQTPDRLLSQQVFGKYSNHKKTSPTKNQEYILLSVFSGKNIKNVLETIAKIAYFDHQLSKESTPFGLN
jgi:hypothetical protein